MLLPAPGVFFSSRPGDKSLITYGKLVIWRSFPGFQTTARNRGKPRVSLEIYRGIDLAHIQARRRSCLEKWSWLLLEWAPIDFAATHRSLWHGSRPRPATGVFFIKCGLIELPRWSNILIQLSRVLTRKF
jgi:hypothetical protein